jgi:hypothetical protein
LFGFAAIAQFPFAKGRVELIRPKEHDRLVRYVSLGLLRLRAGDQSQLLPERNRQQLAMFIRIDVTRITTTILGLLLLSGSSLSAQSVDGATQNKETAARGTKSLTALPVSLEIKSTVQVANLYAAELNARAICGPDRRLYASLFVVRPNAPTGHLLSEDIVAIDRDGKALLNLGIDKITDVQNARLISFFPTEHEIDLLIRAPEDGDPGHAEPKQGGVETLFQKSDHEREFVARFDLDGTYRGSIRMDIPISALQFGVFPTGQFLIAGIDELNHAKVALVKASGQLDRYVELKKSRSEDSSAENAPEPSKEARLFVAAFSRLIANGEDILLNAPDSSTVFQISSSGEVKEIRLQGDNADIVQAVREGWLAESDGTTHGKSARLYSRADGSLVREFVFADKRDLVLGVHV